MDKVAAAFAARYPLIYQLVTSRLKFSLAALAGLFVSIAILMYGQLVYQSEDLVTKAGPVIGGDFIVFRLAASVAGTPDMIAIYEMSNLKEMLEAIYLGKDDLNFAWMYPPTMSLIIAPFGLPPYLAAFALWVALFGGFFLFTTYRLWADKWALFFVAASPAVFQAVITGQNGLMTATLLALAGAFADRRPILAGIAAGLLTVKPQLGLLIPIAFLAAGCWRAFAAAAVTAVALALASHVAYGPESWIGFYEGVTAHGARMGAEGFPYNKLVTPYGLIFMAGAPALVATLVQTAAGLALAAYVAVVWRRVRDWDLRAAALSTAAILATPYAFYYEIVIMAPALLLIARRGVETGWLRYEKLTLIVAWIAPMMMPAPHGTPNISTCAVGAIFGFLIVARRALPAATLTFASAARPAAAD